MMATAVVTGASRGVGRGVAKSLAETGYLVFATGRNIQSADLPSAVVRIRCDHREDSEVTRTFEQISGECEGIDVLVNCAWGGYERMVEDGRFTWPLRFWEQPAHRWSEN